MYCPSCISGKPVKFFKWSFFLILMEVCYSCNGSPRKLDFVPDSGSVVPTIQEGVICRVVSELISGYNYKKVELDDSLSKVIFARYLTSLDGAHIYFLATDVETFKKCRESLDDDIKDGDLNDAFYIFNTFKKRYEERLKFAIAQLNNNFDFTTTDTFSFGREKQPYERSVIELNSYWVNRVKYDLLNLTLAGDDISKNKEILRRRYETLLKQSAQIESDDVFQIFMDAFTEAVDPHTNYFNPINAANFNIDMTRQLEGIGAILGSENEYITVSSLTPGGPADKSGLINTGDRIMAIAQGENGAFQDVFGWRVDNVVKLIRGAKGTSVRLQLLPPGKAATGKPFTVTLIREKVVQHERLAKAEIKTYNNNGRAIKIGIINIPVFYTDYNGFKPGDTSYHTTSSDVKMILDTLKNKGVQGILIDLRENGGGSLKEAIALTGLFIRTGPVVQVRDANNQIEKDDDTDPAIAWKGPLGVLVDRFSASASEIFTGAIQDYGRGIIIGAPTYGKGSVQTQVDLKRIITPAMFEKISSDILHNYPETASHGGTTGNKGQNKSPGADYGQLNLTISKFYRITGNSTQRKGVYPDIILPSLIPTDKYGEDTEPSAMPFDSIAKSNYVKFQDLTTVIPQLMKLHNKRMRVDLSYKYMVETIADERQLESQQSVTLNEALLKQQRDAEDSRVLELDNRRRIAAGLKPLRKGQAKPKNEDLDFLKQESGQIVVDLASLKNSSTKK
jgi:carboxyl-terminal processing protease